MGLDTLLENQLGHWQNFQKLHIHSLSTPRGWSSAYFSSMGSGFWDTGRFSKCHIWVWNLPLAKVPEFVHILLLPQGVEIKLIFGCTGNVSEIRANFQNCHIWAWNLAVAKLPEIAHTVYTVSTPQGRIWTYFALRAVGSEIQANFENCHIRAWNVLGDWPVSARSCTYTLSTPGG